jgi:glutaconyl-CoA/methylmalonyl-CoA decarboxylase subunit gamma
MNKYQYKVKGVDYDVEIEEVEGNVAKVNVNGIPFEVELKEPIKASNIHTPHVVKPAPAAAPAPQAAPAPRREANKATGGTPMKAPLPGTITSVNVKPGDTVNEGDTIVVLEAMKMQNNIESEKSGTVKDVLVKQGDSVLEGDTLIVIA